MGSHRSDAGSDVGEEMSYREAWSSKLSGGGTSPVAQAPALAGRAAELKQAGNAAFAAGRWEAAVAHYTAALKAARLEQPAGGRAHTAALLSNRAAALLRSGQPLLAAVDAENAARQEPGWPKPLFRWAQALAAAQDWGGAARRARQGEALAAGRHGRAPDFEALLDEIAVSGALASSDAGFDGRHLEVRPAGDDAWLGGPAPEDPVLDLTDETAAAASSCLLPYGVADAAAATPGAITTARQRVSFRSVKEAVAAARDGDQILLLAGIHNGMGEAVGVDKRILIHGQGALGEARIDQRANSPAFRLRRSAVLRNIDVDMTGFREAVLVEGKAGVRPLVQRCIIRCSGDDGVNVCGGAKPIFHDCTIQGKKAGVRCFDRATATLQSCRIEECGGAGAMAMDQSHLTMQGCEISRCAEDGILAMQSASLTLQNCAVTGNKGPGLDVSGDAAATIQGGRIAKNVGGVLAWDAAELTMRGVQIEGGVWTALLVNGAATADAEGCHMSGVLHASVVTAAALQGGGNVLVPPKDVAATSLPPDEGAFVWTPDPYTRKM